MRTILVPILLSFAVTTVAAQDIALQPGHRVRVTIPSRDLRKHQDTFERTSGDTLVLGSVRAPLSDVTRIDRYAGRGTKASNILLWGSVGLVAGGAAGYGIGSGTDCYGGDMSPEFCGLVGAAIGGGALMITGIMVGALIKSDKWDEVPVDRLRVSVVPRRDGVGVGLRIGF